MMSNALVRSIKTTPFRRPLMMFTDQACAFVASSKAVSVLCREVNEILIANVVAICYHLMEKLIVNNSFKNSQNYRDYRNWTIVVRIQFNAIFIKWSHFGRFPIVWIYSGEHRGKRGCNDTSSHFQQFTWNHMKTGSFLFIRFRQNVKNNINTRNLQRKRMISGQWALNKTQN